MDFLKGATMFVGMSVEYGRPSNRAIIEACSLFNAVDSDAREKLASVSYPAYAERSEALWVAGNPVEFVAVVGAGFVKMTRMNAAGQEMAMELLGPGQCAGLMVAIEGRSYPLDAIAITNVWYLKVPTRSILDLYAESGAFKDQVIRNIAPRLRKAHDMMSRLSAGRVDERVAAVLFILIDNYGAATPNGIRVNVPLTRQDIGEMAGTTTETAIRVLSKWQKAGIVTTEKQIITVLDESRLSDMLGP